MKVVVGWGGSYVYRKYVFLLFFFGWSYGVHFCFIVQVRSKVVNDNPEFI